MHICSILKLLPISLTAIVENVICYMYSEKINYQDACKYTPVNVLKNVFKLRRLEEITFYLRKYKLFNKI